MFRQAVPWVGYALPYSFCQHRQVFTPSVHILANSHVTVDSTPGANYQTCDLVSLYFFSLTFTQMFTLVQGFFKWSSQETWTEYETSVNLHKKILTFYCELRRQTWCDFVIDRNRRYFYIVLLISQNIIYAHHCFEIIIVIKPVSRPII